MPEIIDKTRVHLGFFFFFFLPGAVVNPAGFTFRCQPSGAADPISRCTSANSGDPVSVLGLEAAVLSVPAVWWESRKSLTNPGHSQPYYQGQPASW